MFFNRPLLPLTFSLLGAIASSSSIKMMAGAFFSASSKAFLRLLSLSPASLLMISGPKMETSILFSEESTAYTPNTFHMYAQNESRPI